MGGAGLNRLIVSFLRMPPSDPSVCQMKLFVSASSFVPLPSITRVFANSCSWNSAHELASVAANSS